MAEINNLTLNVIAKTQGLKDIASEAKKTGAEISKSGQGATSTFAQMNKELEKSALKIGIIGGLIGGFAAQLAILTGKAIGSILSLPAHLISALINAGKVFEQQVARIGATLGQTEVQAERTLEALRSKVADIPIPVNLLVDAFTQLEVINLGGTEHNLEIVASAALSTGKNVEFITNALNNIQPESLRTLGIELKRTKDQATISFNGITIAVANTTQAIREGLIDALGKKFPDGIERAASTLEGALTITKNLISNLVSGPGSDLNKFLTGVVDRVNDWLEANGEIITQDIEAFVIGLETSVKNLSKALSVLTGDFSGASGAAAIFGKGLLVANESVLLLVKGIAAIKATQLSALQLEKINPFDPASLIGADELDKKIKTTQGEFNNLKTIIKDIETSNTNLARGILFPESVKKEMDAARESAKGYLGGVKELSTAQEIINRLLAEGKPAADGFGRGIKGAGEKVSAAKTAIDSLNESMIAENARLVEQIRLTGLEGAARVKVEATIAREKGIKSELVDINEALKLSQLALNEKLEEFQKLVDKFPVVEFTNHLNEAQSVLENIASIKFVSTGVFGISVPFIELKEKATEAVEKTKEELSSLDDFIGNIASNMASTFSDLIFNTLSGDFDSLKDLWKNTLKSMLRIFTDFISAVALNPIRLALDATLGIGGTKGGQGGGPVQAGQQAAGVFGSGLGLFGSGGAFSTLGAGLGLTGAGAGIPGGALALGSETGAALFPAAFAGPGFLATAGAAATVIGAVLAAAALAIALIAPLLKKTPHFAFKFESIKTDIGERAALVKELLDPKIFSDQIFKTLSSHGGGGAFSGKERDALKDAIQKSIAATIKSVQDIINKLPSDMAAILNEELLNTSVDIESKIGRSDLLGFDAKGLKNIKEKLDNFFKGDLPARILESIRGFFSEAFVSLGALPGAVNTFIDEQFAAFQKAGSQEARAQIGQDLLKSFSTFVDAFNIISGHGTDSIEAAVNSLKNLSQSLGFEAIPSIEQLRVKLQELVGAAQVDPQTIQSVIDLRAAIIQLRTEILNSISSIIGNIQSLNATIASFGGTATDITGFLNTAIGDIQNILNQGGLSSSDQEALLGQLTGFANQLLAEEQAAFQAAQQAQQAANEAQRAGIQARIDGFNHEKDKINEAFKVRIDALNEELRVAEQFASLTESIKSTLDSIIFSPESVLTGVEQVSALQTRINDLQTQLSSAASPDIQLKLAGQLQDAFKTLFSTAGDAFGINSPEFVAIFDQVTGGLKNLADLTDQRGRTVEDISASIEKLTALNNDQLKSIDAKIQAAQDQLAAIGTATANNTFRASQALEDLFNYIRTQYIELLQAQFDSLGQISDTGFQSDLDALSSISGGIQDQLVQLRDNGDMLKRIADYTSRIGSGGGGSGSGLGINAFATGGVLNEPVRGVGRSGRNYLFGEKGPEMFIPRAAFMNHVTNRSDSHIQHDLNVNIGGHIEVTGNMSDTSLKMFADRLGKNIAKQTKEEIIKEISGPGRLRGAVQSASKSVL